MGIVRAAILIAALAWGAFAGNFKLYLTDGSHHVVREYQVTGDRVRFYSIERSDWEEMPLELADLKKTEAERAGRAAALKAEAEAQIAEDQAERERRRQIRMVPPEVGVYLIEGEKLTPLKQAESKVASSKKRTVLKVITPIPIVAGKSRVELDGEASQQVVTQERPEFFFRLVHAERFTILRLKPQKGVRVVQTWNIVPVSNELFHEHDEVEVFRQQVGEGLYKIWPQKPLAPGEYAVVEYTDGKGNIQVWDFSCRPAGRS